MSAEQNRENRRLGESGSGLWQLGSESWGDNLQTRDILEGGWREGAEPEQVGGSCAV